MATVVALLLLLASAHRPAWAGKPIEPVFLTGSSAQPLGGAFLSAAGADVYWEKPDEYPGPSWSLLLGQSGGPTSAGWPATPGRLPTLSREAAEIPARLATLRKACTQQGRALPTRLRIRFAHDGYDSKTVEVPSRLFAPGRHAWPEKDFEKLVPRAHPVVFRSQPEGAVVRLQTAQGSFLGRTGETTTLLMPLFLSTNDRYAERTLVYVLPGYTTRQEIVRPAELEAAVEWPPDGPVLLQAESLWVKVRDEARRLGWLLGLAGVLGALAWRRASGRRALEGRPATVRFRPGASVSASSSETNRVRAGGGDTMDAAGGPRDTGNPPAARPHGDGRMLEGPQVGRWVLGERLGQGGSATVYRGVPFDGEGPEVAIKILDAEAADDRAQRTRFEREVAISCRLSHPNIIRIIDWGPHENSMYLAMELLEGPSLRRMIQGGMLSPSRFYDIFRALLEATRFAHSQGVVHRDLKPENVLTTARGVAKVVDFGIARGAQFATVTTTGHAMGTLAYLPPERFVAAMHDDPRSDQYALGIIGYEMLAGRRPYPDAQLPEVLLGVISTPPPDLRSLRADVPAAVVYVIERLMNPDPEARFAGAEQALEALDDAFSVGSPEPEEEEPGERTVP